MAENGLDLRTYLTVVGVLVMFLGFPAASIAFAMRKERRKQADATTASAAVPVTIPLRTHEPRNEHVPMP